MRIIDADLLKKNIAKWLQGGDPQETQMVKLDDIAVSVIMEIDEQPTVYDYISCEKTFDVDKVAELIFGLLNECDIGLWENITYIDLADMWVDLIKNKKIYDDELLKKEIKKYIVSQPN